MLWGIDDERFYFRSSVVHPTMTTQLMVEYHIQISDLQQLNFRNYVVTVRDIIGCTSEQLL